MIKLLATAAMVVALGTALGTRDTHIDAGIAALRNAVTSIGSPVNRQGDEQDGDREIRAEPDAQDADEGESQDPNNGSEP